MASQRASYRCDLCGLPMDDPGQTGYCSERCLHWDFFGVPALKENELVAEMRGNQNGSPREGRPAAYPDLFTDEERRLITETLALLKIESDHLRNEQ